MKTLYAPLKYLFVVGAVAVAAVNPFAVPITNAASVTVPLQTGQVTSTTLSENWAGYMAKGGVYTNITGTWTVPTVDASQTVAADAAWIGIGGSGSKDLIQAGTEAITEQGKVLYQAWYELLPDNSTPVSLAVSPGDSITATITETASNVWTITIQNNTTGIAYSTSVHYSSSHSSAEWIQEMPSDGNGFLPLDTFSAVNFTNASVIANGQWENLSQAGVTAVSLVNDRSLLATPSALSTDGTSFTVTRNDTASDIAPRIVRRAVVRGPDSDQQVPSSSSARTPWDVVQQFTVGPWTVRVMTN